MNSVYKTSEQFDIIVQWWYHLYIKNIAQYVGRPIEDRHCIYEGIKLKCNAYYLEM